jgi:hypothetical protein
MYDTASVTASCPHCSNPIEITQRWTPGGMNDYGGYVLECLECHKVFSLHLGRDINDSLVNEGAKVLDTYDNELGDKSEVLSKHHLSID